MFSAHWSNGKGPAKNQKTLDKMAFFRYNLFRLAAGGKQGEKVKPEGCFIMEPTRNPRGGPKKDEQTEKAKGCLRVELKNKQRHPAGRAGMKSCKHKKSISC